MASITIQHGSKNLVFAAQVANQTGAKFREHGQWIIIEDSPTLTIPDYCFRDAFDPDRSRFRQGDLESAWRSLLLNKRGYLKYFGDDEIVITDDPPEEKRPTFLLRFETAAEKEAAEQLAETLGYESLTDYILAAIKAFNQAWQEKKKK